ncbi:MAG: hypothetical protein UH239_10175 [Acutalibacteraceae bacterium]|nr:hypothetical protein [Acutalibacteraceae bacterium]
MFGKLSNATVKNVTVKDAVIKAYYSSGAIVGSVSSSTLENCHAVGVDICADYRDAGGIAGLVRGNTVLRLCTSSGKIYANEYSGGISGGSPLKIEYCMSTATVLAGKTSNEYSAGIANGAGNMHSCIYLGNKVTSGYAISGTVQMDSSNISNCWYNSSTKTVFVAVVATKVQKKSMEYIRLTT